MKKPELIGNETMTKEETVYLQIKQAVLHNEFKPGTILVERKLSELYKVSRSPVRYALRQLAKEGLLEDESGKGIVVPTYTLEDILEIYDLWEVLQIYALQVSLKNYNMIADATLGQIMEQTKKFAEAGDMIERMEADIKFHNFIIHYVNNKRLDMMFELLVNQKRRIDTASFDDVQHGKQANAQHEQIFAAIKSRDLDACITAVKEHSSFIKQYYINKLVTEKYNV